MTSLIVKLYGRCWLFALKWRFFIKISLRMLQYLPLLVKETVQLHFISIERKIWALVQKRMPLESAFLALKRSEEKLELFCSSIYENSSRNWLLSKETDLGHYFTRWGSEQKFFFLIERGRRKFLGFLERVWSLFWQEKFVMYFYCGEQKKKICLFSLFYSVLKATMLGVERNRLLGFRSDFQGRELKGFSFTLHSHITQWNLEIMGKKFFSCCLPSKWEFWTW